MEKKMKKVGLTMSVLMGITLSFCLSLTGNLMGVRQSGSFSVPGFLISFVISTVISIILGFIIPMKKISDSVQSKNGGIGSVRGRLVDSLVSDLIYTPLLTFIMVFLAHRNAVAAGAQIPFVPMFLSSLLVSLIVAYIIIFLISPLFIRAALKINGIQGGPGGPGGPGEMRGGPGGPVGPGGMQGGPGELTSNEG